MELVSLDKFLGLVPLAFIPAFYMLSPASKSTKLWTIFYVAVLVSYGYYPQTFKDACALVRNYVVERPVQAAFIACAIGAPLKYAQRKLRFARVNAIKTAYGFTHDPSSYGDMTVEQAQEIESNMAEVSLPSPGPPLEFPRLWQFGWISDFLRASTNPGVARTINSSGHFLNQDKRIEHQRMQATIHLMTAFAAYKVKSPENSLVIARINDHHHRHGIKINSDDVLYLVVHFSLAPVPWINAFGYRSVEPFEVHAIWVLWRELACRMGVKYIPKTLSQAKEWRRNFEKTFRWREDANETMAKAMLNQVLFSIPIPLKAYVARVLISIVDWDIVYYCRLEKLQPSFAIREVLYGVFRLCGWLIREFGLPRLSPYQRSPPSPNKHGKWNFGHTPYDTLPYWQEASFWNLWGPGALLRRVRGLPLPGSEYQSEGIALEAMGARHMHAGTQAAIESKVRENAVILETAPYGYRPAVGFQARRLIPSVEGPSYGSDMNVFSADTPTTPNGPIRFSRQYETRGPCFSKVDSTEKLEDLPLHAVEATQEKSPNPPESSDLSRLLKSAPVVMVST